VDIALELLMLPKYKNLRRCIYATESEQKRFRQLLVHCVLATDIFDPDFKARRNLRWDKAFHPSIKESLHGQEDMNRKANIVLEHIIQASDVSHTMQHWHVYIKWNERLYQEMYAAYKADRAKTDPTDGWYKAEMWFYDNYVIPLAKKLKECRVFGVSSDEYLDYATQNRIEWVQRGEMIVQSMKERVLKLYEKVEKAPDMEGDESEHVYQELEEERLKLPDLNAGNGDELNDGHNSLHSYSNH
jgi:3'5'-cyclic nucleotide phosphodiesterase